MSSNINRIIKLALLRYPDVLSEVEDSLNNIWNFVSRLYKNLNGLYILKFEGYYYIKLPVNWTYVKYVFYKGKRYDFSSLYLPLYVPDLYYSNSDGKLYTCKLEKKNKGGNENIMISYRFDKIEKRFFHPHGSPDGALCVGDIPLDKLTLDDLYNINLESLMVTNTLTDLLKNYINIIEGQANISVTGEWRVNE